MRYSFFITLYKLQLQPIKPMVSDFQQTQIELTSCGEFTNKLP